MAKKIVLLADGTGNGLLVQTSNICRLSRALDISQKDQLVFYIPGVGTEEFKPLAAFDGATGLGVPSNVRKLYRFLSWNWEPGATVYMFGFSRGAFTIRMLVDLVVKQGLAPTSIAGRRVSHQEMVRNSEDAWRAFCAKDEVRNTNIWVRLGVRRLRDAFLGVARMISRQPDYATIQAEAMSAGRGPGAVDIDFLGLFDTVEAYGVPIEEMREGVHTLVFPIKFGGDHTIAPQVKRVRQALSLDDERRTFHPIRVALSENDAAGKRVEEVWFAGVHSDVGGGYPDDAAAHVPLVWMIAETERAMDDPGRRLMLLEGAVDGFRAMASPFGPLHNSRAGLATLYRYDPRTVKDRDERGHRYCRPLVHHSVVERLVDGHDEYAPLALGAAEVVMPDGAICAPETGPGFAQVKSADPAAAATVSALAPDSQQLARARGALRRLDAPDEKQMDVARDYVWLNRIAYFAYFALFVAVLLLPMLDSFIDAIGDAIASAAQTIFGGASATAAVAGSIGSKWEGLSNAFRGLADAILSITPSYLTPHAEAAARHPWFALFLLVAFLGLRSLTAHFQDKIHYHARQAWSVQGEKATKAADAPGPLARLLRTLRTNPFIRALRGALRPGLPLLYAVCLIILPALVLGNRFAFNFLVGAGDVCRETKLPRWPGLEAAEGLFHTNDPCWASGWSVESGGAYRLTIDVDPGRGHDPWLDQLLLTDPYGFDTPSLAFAAATVLRRWPSVAWFHPIARIGANGDVEWPLVPVGGGRPLSARAPRCTLLPVRYDATEERKVFCGKNRQIDSCRARELNLALGEPLPRDELPGAAEAWSRERFTRDGAECVSVFPRRRFVSEFVAGDTGELFLFVNDAVHATTKGRAQIFYANNSGTAAVTLERLPRVAPTAAPR